MIVPLTMTVLLLIVIVVDLTHQVQISKPVAVADQQLG